MVATEQKNIAINSINPRNHFTIYNKAVQSFIDKDSNFLQQIRNSNISQAEKKLLLARNQMRKQQWTESKNTIHSIITTNQFLLAEKFFLLGTVYFYQGKNHKAAEDVHQAYQLYCEINDQKGKFLTSYNMSIYLDRTGEFDRSNQFLSIANELAESTNEKLLMLRGYACKFSREGNYAQAKNLVDNILSNSEHMSISDREGFYTVAFDLLFRGGFYSQAKGMLKKLKHLKIYHTKERAIFENEVLSILENGSSFPNCPEIVKTSAEFSTKWEILRNIQAGNIQHAQKAWQQLKKIVPGKIENNFGIVVCTEEKTIFSLCLKKLIKHKINIPSQTMLPKNKLSRLGFVLTNTTYPINKEGLIEKIWEDNYHPRYDARFYKLIERYKREYNKKIIYRNGGYTLT